MSDVKERPLPPTRTRPILSGVGLISRAAANENPGLSGTSSRDSGMSPH